MFNCLKKIIGVFLHSYALAICLCIAFLCSCHSKHNLTDNRDKTEPFITRAAFLADNHNTTEAFAYLDSVAALPWTNIIDEHRFLGLKYMIYFRTLRKPDSALIIADSLVYIAENKLPEDCLEEKAMSYFSKGDALFQLQQFNDAYLCYYKGKVIGKKSYSACLLSDYDYRMGMVLYKQNRFKEASSHFKDAFNNSASCTNTFISYYRKQEVLNNTGLCYQQIGANDSAIKYYDLAAEFIKANGNQFAGREMHNAIALAVIAGNKATAYKNEKNFARAIPLFKESIGINNKDYFDNNDAQICRIKLADIYLQMGYNDSAQLILQYSDSLIKKNNYSNKFVLQEWYGLMWRLHKTKGDNDVAYDYLTKHTMLKDSLQKIKAKIQALDAGQQIRMFETEFEIESLQKSNKLKNSLIIVAAFSLVLITAIVFLLFNIRKRNRRHIKSLRALNKTIGTNKIELEETLKKLETENRNKTNIFKILAHDLRSPIVSMTMLTDLLKTNTHEPEKLEMLNMMQTAGNNTLDLITEMLEAANPLPAGSSTALKRVELNSLIFTSVNLLKLKAAEKQQTLTLNITSDVITVNATEERLTRVINNLVNNAIKFSNSGTEIIVTLVKLNKNEAQVCIRDSGIGIPSSLKNTVFDMFTDAKRYGTNGEKAYGLGLAITKQIIEGFNGKIWFKSKAGKGTTFYFTLPLVK